ncbi:hypothetical protein TNCV_1584621 [Trichonephila clavipes]|nr:hypothetical protein TNCV_1584621 [Trichonephila clavipes]
MSRSRERTGTDKETLPPAQRSYHAFGQFREPWISCTVEIGQNSVQRRNSIIAQEREELRSGRSQPLPTSSSAVSFSGTPTCDGIHWRHLFPLTKRSQFGNNFQTSTVHNFWPLLQILDGAPAVCQDPDTVLIRVESTTDSNEFRSKGGTGFRIPGADFYITPGSVTKYTTPCSTRIRTATVCINNQGLIGYIIYYFKCQLGLSNSGWLLCFGVLVSRKSI